MARSRLKISKAISLAKQHGVKGIEVSHAYTRGNTNNRIDIFLKNGNKINIYNAPNKDI